MNKKNQYTKIKLIKITIIRRKKKKTTTLF